MAIQDVLRLLILVSIASVTASGSTVYNAKTKLFFFSIFFDTEWPEYMRVWLMSMSYHPEFHWTIITNLPDYSLTEIPSEKLSNIHFVNSSLAEVNRSASEVLGYDAGISKAYKLCDFRPLFGKIFRHFITPDYTHWGYGDLDSVIGNAMDLFSLRDFSNDFDIVSPICDHVVLNGPFSIMRNTDKMNNLYLRMDEKKLILQLRDNQHAWIDELQMNELTLPLVKTGELSVVKSSGHGYICCSKHVPKIWAFYRGKLYAPMNRQCLYYHFGGGESKASRNFKQLFTYYIDMCLLNNKDPRSQGLLNGFGFTHTSFYCFVRQHGQFQVIGMDTNYGSAFHKSTKVTNYTVISDEFVVKDTGMGTGASGGHTLLREKDGKEVPPELWARMSADFNLATWGHKVEALRQPS